MATKKCPPATTDVAINLRNREKAIKTAAYGPLNPAEPNDGFWEKKAERWDVSTSSAKKSICGNCAAFIKTERMIGCIKGGLGNEEGDSAWDTIKAGDLGYCEAFDFKCASSRTCDAWITGGPITQEKEEKSLDDELRDMEILSIKIKSDDDDVETAFQKLMEISELVDVEEQLAQIAEQSMVELKYDEMMPIFDEYYSSAVLNKAYGETLMVKGSKKPVLRDPKGGLTAAGRAYFKRKEGANLKPGVRGPANTPEKMRRKGSFLTRFFTNPSGPMKDEKGRATRLALSAAAWGEPVPKNMEDAAKLAAKGRRLLERYGKAKKQKKSEDFISIRKDIFFTGGYIPNDMDAKDLMGIGSIHDLIIQKEDDEFSEEFFVRTAIRKKMMNYAPSRLREDSYIPIDSDLRIKRMKTAAAQMKKRRKKKLPRV